MPKAIIKRVALAKFRCIVALDDLNASSLRDCCSVIRAIVRNYKQPVTLKQLTLNIRKRW
jgi:hypothetical protein